MNRILLMLCLAVVLVALCGCESGTNVPEGSRAVTAPDGKVYIVPNDAKVSFRYVKRDSTKMASQGGTFDTSSTEVKGDVNPGGPAAFDLKNLTLSQAASAFAFQVKSGTAFGVISLIGAAAVLGGVGAWIVTKNKSFLWLSAAGAGLVILGYFLQAYGLVLLIAALVLGAIVLILWARKQGLLSADLDVTWDAIKAIVRGVEKAKPVTVPADAPETVVDPAAEVKRSIAEAMTGADAKALDAVVDEAKAEAGVLRP